MKVTRRDVLKAGVAVPAVAAVSIPEVPAQAQSGCEFDSYEYVRDAIAAGAKKGAIFISHEASEEAGMDEFARWIKPIVPEVPVQFVPTRDDFWTV